MASLLLFLLSTMTYCFCYCFAQRGWTATRRSGKSGGSPRFRISSRSILLAPAPPKDLLPLPTDTHQFLFCEGMCSVVAKLQHSHLKEPLLALSRGCGPFLPRVVEGDVADRSAQRTHQACVSQGFLRTNLFCCLTIPPRHTSLSLFQDYYSDH